MAPGDKLVGRRLPTLEDGRLMTVPEQPGDYCGPVTGYNGGKPAVYFLKPNARDDDAPAEARSVQFVLSPPHTFTEEDDGSLTITASISDVKRGGGSSDGWHGYLTKGVWGQV